jgi:transposase
MLSAPDWRALAGRVQRPRRRGARASAVPAAARPGGAGPSGPDWTVVDKELRCKGVTLALLWEEYRAAHPDGFGYSWFCEHYGAFKSRLRPSMRQSHAAGEKVFVDCAGGSIDVIDPATGEVRPMKLFVAAVGASNYIFAQARPSEQIADWIGAHVDLFAFLGGAPKFVVCDNLKAAVTNPDRYEPGLNRSYVELAEHYGAAILPARPCKPRDKAEVEQSVLIAERWILARLRHRRFFSVADLNAAIAELVDDINARVMKGYNASRADLFATIDKPALKQLPDEPYAFAVWKRCRVAPDYHVEVDRHLVFRAVPPDPRTRRRAPRRQDGRDLPQGAARRRPCAGAEPARPHDDRRAHAELPSSARGLDAGPPRRLRRNDRPVDRRAHRGDHGRPPAPRTGLSNLPGHPRPDALL